MNKTCTKCGVEKPLSEFYLKKEHALDGRKSACKKCTNEQKAIYCEKNKERLRNYYLNYKRQNKQKYKEWNAASYNRNKDKKNERARRWAANNPDKVKEARLKATKKIYSTVKGKLSNAIRGSLYHSLKVNKAGRHWEDLVGYTVADLKHHLEKHFLPGMTWENYGRYGWHIDHQIPVSAFNFEKPEHIDFKKCWALKNLRPLWAFDNLSKHNRLDRPFQPSLLLQ